MSATFHPSFATFFRAIHGHEPFPWQARAAERLARREVFQVAVPTGLGKSALVDAAIWAAAQGAWRRIAYVVDRRIVVDAVHDRARRIQSVLAQTQDEGLQAFAARLGEMQVVRLRGGVHGDDDWVLHPERLTVALTTVDQIGSRLMFRGYGVSPRRWPMHAAFFGSDTLVIVDEAHLSVPFVQTLAALREAGARVDLLPMSATLPREDGVVLRLDWDDLALPTVAQRLRASKLARLVVSEGTEQAMVKTLTGLVSEASATSAVRTIAVIVNRVATARLCFDRLTKDGVTCALLIGRTRPVARDRVLAELLPRLEAGRPRQTDEAPLVVVATQTIEVGADFDVDALVSESAPLSSLRQRFGRLDRLGLRGTSAAWIVHRQGKVDPVYGEAEGAAWDWLNTQASDDGDRVVDFGLDALSARLATNLPPAEAPCDAATLLPSHVEALAQTGVGVPDIDLAAWLHGPKDRAPDVTLLWRDDLLPEDPGDWVRAVQLLPPMQRESLSLPAPTLRQWLAGKADRDLSDLDGAASDDPRSDTSERPVLRWRGPEHCEVITARQIRPGDTLLLPAGYGGCDRWGWAPNAVEPVEDLADAVLQETGVLRRPVARLASGHWSAWGEHAQALRERVHALREMEVRAVESDEDLSDELEAMRQALLAMARSVGHPLLSPSGGCQIEPHPQGFVLRGQGIEEVEGAIETGRAVTLDVHHQDVARWAERLAVEHPRREAIVQAAVVHDAGKAESRMQALLHGSLLAAQVGPALAKSARRRRADQLAAWRNAQVPRGFRHEFASLHFSPQADPLVRHLIATHHGHARPWGPRCADEAVPGADLAGLERHWARDWAAQLQAQGPWRLAEMEWLMRAADARASIEEAQQAPAEGDDDEPR